MQGFLSSRQMKRETVLLPCSVVFDTRGLMSRGLQCNPDRPMNSACLLISLFSFVLQTDT